MRVKSGEGQISKFTELDIGGRETCLNMIKSASAKGQGIKVGRVYKNSFASSIVRLKQLLF